jgi:broad specificity phosphatase PhoE
VRHAQSVGNVADEEARKQGAARLDLDARDADVELSDTGRGQAEALGPG